MRDFLKSMLADDLVTSAELSELTGIHQGNLRHMLANKKQPPESVLKGNTLLFDVKDWQYYIDKKKGLLQDPL